MTYILFVLSVVCSILSQHPYLTGTSVAALLNYTWAFTLLYILIVNISTLKVSKLIASFFVFSIIIALYVSVFVPSNYDEILLDMDVYFIFISFIISLSSYLFWYYYANERFINILSLLILVIVAIVSYVIYYEYIVPTSIEAFEYAYGDKNSIATIILSALVICFYNHRSSNKLLSFFVKVVFAFLIIMLFLLKSRASLLGLFFVIFWISFKDKNKRIRNIVLGCFFVFIIILLFNEQAYSIIIENILMGNRTGGNLNDLSSGRMEQIKNGLLIFSQNPFFGYGKYYVDCFPIAMLSSFGFIGFIVIYQFLFRLGVFVCTLDKSVPIYYTTFFLYFIFIINSFFEAHAPFGPGVKCFLFWMMLGFSSAEITKNKYLLD